VTAGIVSAVDRSGLGINVFENFIQTDAAINQGNSGGALIDARGNLIGINTAIVSQSGGSIGIGFAIPAATTKTVPRADRAHGLGRARLDRRRDAGRHGGHRCIVQALGVTGALISGVLRNGPADKAGSQAGRRAAIGRWPSRSIRRKAC
jgi:serine protease DegQ